MPSSALKERMKKYGITGKERLRLERALNTLADFEGQVKHALRETTAGGERSHTDVCHALRELVDD